MQLSGFVQALQQIPAYGAVLDRLQADGSARLNVIQAARPLIVAALAQSWPGPVLVLTARVKRAYNVAEQLPVWLGDAAQRPVLRFNEPIPVFYERASWGEGAIVGRIQSLAALLDDSGASNPVVVSSARAMMQCTLPPNAFRQRQMHLRVGQRHTIDSLLSAWLRLGYQPAPIVLEPGTFSRRGGVVDIFPITAPLPLRLDFFDDEIDSIRRFDPATQRSQDRIEAATITPAREAPPELAPQIARHLADWFDALPAADDDMTAAGADYEPLSQGTAFPFLEFYLPYMVAQPVGLLDYAPTEALVIVEDWHELRDTVEQISEAAVTAREAATSAGGLPPDLPQPYVGWDLLQAALADHTTLHLTQGDVDDALPPVLPGFDGLFQPGGRFGGQLRPMLTDLRQRRGRNERVVVVTEQAERLRQLWHEQDGTVFVPAVQDLTRIPAAGSIQFINGVLGEGWAMNHPTGRLNLLTDAEIFGWSRPEPRRRKATTRRARAPEADYADWNDGDYVVHIDYGVGQFAGLLHRTVDGNEREYILIRYADNGTIYVPIHQADRVTRYIGVDDHPPLLNKLGKAEWQRVRGKAQQSVQEEARELLALYKQRIGTAGYAFTPDNHWQHELEASFPYVETEDQLRSLREVKADMEASFPMDRLICGDVGFGKTEVALRAAFKAVTDGKQVALLVPTTVLAQQHYDTFSNRLAAFPLEIEMMSRFRTKEEQARLLPRIASGEVDILIGTHRILSSDVTFKDLGLVVIDEEQRFGVKHKEHFKRLRTQVDVLTLTATPIPRTLYMSMTGVRDISMIQTPPEERLPIITHVGRFDEHLVRQAILREMERGGQVFIVHNRVRTIETLRERIEEIVPEARIIVGHGQMNERELQRVMVAFAHQEYDILVATSIIESGIDIPNANTLIVDRADRMGLAQLYQLRGRVGRSAQQGYAYFFHPRRLTEEARARLDTLAENTGLGSGFNIAMRDLEIRGAGDVLSTRQTGHVSAIGLHLYTQLLDQTVKTMKGEMDVDSTAFAGRGLVIDLPLPAYIPHDWIPDMALRLQIYRRIGALADSEAVTAMRSELVDRFGQLPDAVDNLLYQIEIKLLGQQVKATHIQVMRRAVQIKLPFLGEINREALAQHLGEDVSVSRTAISFPQDDDGLWKLRVLDLLAELGRSMRLSERLNERLQDGL